MKIISKFFLLMIFFLAPSVVLAQQLPSPISEVILSVYGQIESTNQDEMAVFDMSMLQELEVKTYETHTPWSDNSYRFRGATLTSILDYVKAKEGSEITLYALDGYQVNIAWKDAVEFKPILAYSRNNVPMSRRDRGPLWLVFPLDNHSALKNARYDNYWVWQLTRIEVK